MIVVDKAMNPQHVGRDPARHMYRDWNPGPLLVGILALAEVYAL